MCIRGVFSEQTGVGSLFHGFPSGKNVDYHKYIGEGKILKSRTYIGLDFSLEREFNKGVPSLKNFLNLLVFYHER